jgi:hypothetical protein
LRSTYARELGAAVTALGDSAALLDVKKAELTTGSSDNTGSVGTGVPAIREKLYQPTSFLSNLHPRDDWGAVQIIKS